MDKSSEHKITTDEKMDDISNNNSTWHVAIREKYIACMLLQALGDTIGFKNGDWEFNYGRKNITCDITLEILYEFIYLGGINGINLNGWHVSDDALFNMAIASALIKSKNNNDVILNKIKSEFSYLFEKIQNELNYKVNRYIGITTAKYIQKFTDKIDGRFLGFDPMTGGNGAAMRTHSIGLAFFGKSNRDKLIDIAIESSRMTHNSPIGFLGGLVTALFTAFAIEGVFIEKWPFKMLKILESDAVLKYIRKDSRRDEEAAYDEFIMYWKKYIDLRFDKDVLIHTKAMTNLFNRSRFYLEHFTRGTKGKVIGDSGYSSTIMAYDCLLDAGNNWEKLVIYSMLHCGDSDTVGAIAGGLYGALYGFGDVPESNLKYLEYKKELEVIGDALHKRFVLNEEIVIPSKFY